jgi:hypothetical protein
VTTPEDLAVDDEANFRAAGPAAFTRSFFLVRQFVGLIVTEWCNIGVTAAAAGSTDQRTVHDETSGVRPKGAKTNRADQPFNAASPNSRRPSRSIALLAAMQSGNLARTGNIAVMDHTSTKW